MSTSTTPAADAAREAARQDNGQFGTQHRAEADVALDDPGARVDPALIAQYLGEGPELTADEQRMLDILTSSANHDYLSGYVDDESMLEEVEGYGTGGDWYGATQIGELLYAHYERELDDDRVGGMRFELHRTGDYEVGSYAVGVNLGHDLGYLTTHEDSKYLTREYPDDMSGLRQAIKIAEVIDGDFQAVRARAVKAGLLPGSKPKPVWPQDNVERAVFAQWQYEVSNGDTAIDFRTYFENQMAEIDDERDHAETLPGQPGHDDSFAARMTDEED